MKTRRIAPGAPVHGTVWTLARETGWGRAPGPIARSILLLTVLLCVAVDASAQRVLLRPGDGEAPQHPPLPESVLEQRATQFVAAVNIEDPAAMMAFIRESGLVPDSEGAMEFAFRAIADVRAHTGGVELISSRFAGGDPLGPGVELVVKNRLTGWEEPHVLILEPEPPHRMRVVVSHSAEPPADVPAGPISDERLARETEDLVSALAEADAFSGAVLFARGDEVLFAGAYGEAHKGFGVPNTLDTRFSLGSMNKMFTGVAIAQLVEAGKLSFEDPLSKFLPDHFAPGVAEKVQIRHLLTHTAGLGNYFNREYMESSRARFRTIDDVLELERGDSLAFEPGTGSRYSNTGFLVLGKIVELVSGQDYHDYVREHIYLPAGMTDTGELELDRVNPDVAVGYDKEYTEEGIRYRNNAFDLGVRGGPAGGGYSTVGDIHRFALALLGGTLVSPGMVETLTTPKPELASPAYGYGFRQWVPDGTSGERFTVGHGGGFPGVSSDLSLDPSTGRVLVTLSNYGGAAFRILPLRKLLLQ